MINEWIKHDVNVETFCAVTAPAICFRADIAATEDFEVAWEFDEFLNDFVFINAAKEAEIIEFIRDIICDVGAEIVFEIDALGILMVNGRTGNIALVGGSFIAQNDVGLVVEISDDDCCKSEAGREWNVAVVEALLVELEHSSVDGEVEIAGFGCGVAGEANTVERGVIFWVKIAVEVHADRVVMPLLAGFE